ncbi:GNAT family N-acetyltransferase [Streptomyces aureoverticillatus]|uniref:GNAT family N-acetyltransferase n=1 Tax=Streptomyces aureoverticillatus TaxID=66871 RepID=UPI0013DA5F92|nr:GNAT family N-acetyltransferase [Streptomyces aureoverticillatus]QIB43606.1 GNAT family N-acetyltransferase [Streptomyces aureoverticillatus]
MHGTEGSPTAGSDVVRAWVDGWVVSRGAAPPAVEPWGFTVDVGQANHPTRHVLGATGAGVQEADVRKVATSVIGANVWLKVFDHPDRVTPWLGPEWWLDPEPGYLMTVPLTPVAPHRLTAPDGYRLRTWARGGVIRTMVTTADGSWAARGQIAPTGRTAVADQIETSPQHRRKGLGSLVMRALTVAAVEQGVETGVLAGTPDGRALYESLGWQVIAELTSARRKSVEEEAEEGEVGA